jgi:hypothetical protein
MTMSMAIFVCDSETEAEAAGLVLEDSGYESADIKIEEVSALLYNGKQFSDGVVDQFMAPKWVVIGRN